MAKHRLGVKVMKTCVGEIPYHGDLSSVLRISDIIGKDGLKDLIIFSSSNFSPDCMFSLNYESAKMLLKYSLSAFSKICSKAGKNPKAELAEILFQ